MPCCQKTRKAQIKKLMERRTFEIEGFSMLKRLKSKPHYSLQDSLLLNYHRKTHKLYNQAIKLKPVNRIFINQVIEVHNSIIAELQKREIEHASPIQMI